MKRWMALCLMMACMLVCGAALAEEETRVVEAGSISAVLPVKGAQIEVRSTRIDGEEWLFLPAFADVEAMALSVEGRRATWENAALEDGVWMGEVRSGDEALLDLRMMRSENLRALFLFSDDPVNQGRAYIDNCDSHVNETTGAMAIVDIDGTVDCADHLRQLRGRGNYSWKREKKPYQFKLENRADLLKTGDSSESNRTWVLLAEMVDGTFLHNRIALDMGLEMGIEETSHSEHVDLYYDGEYRGLYLLAEKVEIGEGRIEETDYDEIIEALNDSIGQTDLEALEMAYEDHPWYEKMYSYVQDLAEPEDPGAGAYMLEMENEIYTLTDRCWFRLSDSSVIASKNPENASKQMMLYISTRLEEARQTLKNGGVNPQNGRTIHDDFDVEAFAKIFLVNEMCYNVDSYSYSSSWFVLPAGEKQFRPAAPWDFDLSMRLRRSGANQNGADVKVEPSWTTDFYNCDAFTEAFQRLYLEQMKPMVESILLGQQHGRYLKPLDAYVQEIDASRRMDNRIWDFYPYADYLYAEDFESEIENLRAFLAARHAWMQQAVGGASPHTADAVTLWGNAIYGHVDGEVRLYAAPWSNVSIVSCTWEMISEATEEDYAVWQLEAIIAPQEGYAFENPAVTFGMRPISHEMQEDGSLRILVTFEDPSYRPVDYYGEDIGLIYNPDVYAQNYPEIAAEYEDDPEGLMNYFCDDGMYEDHMGNAFFKPSEILHHNEDLNDILGEDWQLYYWDFLYYGYTDGWLLPGGGRGFGLEVTDAL